MQVCGHIYFKGRSKMVYKKRTWIKVNFHVCLRYGWDQESTRFVHARWPGICMYGGPPCTNKLTLTLPDLIRVHHHNWSSVGRSSVVSLLSVSAQSSCRRRFISSDDSFNSPGDEELLTALPCASVGRDAYPSCKFMWWWWDDLCLY